MQPIDAAVLSLACQEILVAKLVLGTAFAAFAAVYHYFQWNIEYLVYGLLGAMVMAFASWLDSMADDDSDAPR